MSLIDRLLEADSGDWDAILLLDVLEHFEHAPGAAMLQQLRLRLTPEGRLFVGTPAVWMDQGPAYGNEFERHRSLWTGDELRAIGFELLDGGATDRYGNQAILGVAKVDSGISDSADELSKRIAAES